jgi:uncharacterized protein YeeX (DUF496 family)
MFAPEDSFSQTEEEYSRRRIHSPGREITIVIRKIHSSRKRLILLGPEGVYLRALLNLRQVTAILVFHVALILANGLMGV